MTGVRKGLLSRPQVDSDLCKRSKALRWRSAPLPTPEEDKEAPSLPQGSTIRLLFLSTLALKEQPTICPAFFLPGAFLQRLACVPHGQVGREVRLHLPGHKQQGGRKPGGGVVEAMVTSTSKALFWERLAQLGTGSSSPISW